jgi:hypothetical protein
MLGKLLKIALFITVVAAVLYLFDLTKYLDIQSISAYNWQGLAHKVSDLGNLSSYLKGFGHRLSAEHACTSGALLLLVLSRGMLMRKVTD